MVERGRVGETYLIGGRAERTNIAVVTRIAELVDEIAPPLATGRPRRELVAFVADRPGHDYRYAMDISKIERELGWTPARSFDEGLQQAVDWFVANESWWLPLLGRYGGERLGVAAARRSKKA